MNALHDRVQSAYRARHSTETALLRVHHDIASALDNNCSAVLVMLDLSAAFDVIDHPILIQRLEHSYGISGQALMWIQSYLQNRKQRVVVGSAISNDKQLTFGVPQGSVLGPKFYCMFAKPIGEICRRHNMNYHSYADDTQVYLILKPSDNWDNFSTRLENCLADISSWMRLNRLKLNQSKTELIVFASKRHINDLKNCQLNFDGTIVGASEIVKNLGVYFDRLLSMEKQVSAISRACFFQMRNIGYIRPYLSDNACKTLVCSLVTSRLDYGNALLYGVNKNITSRLQRVQNTAARLVTRTKKREHITPVLKRLHWLPVEFRCQYKLLLYTFKAVTGQAPDYLVELIEVYKPSRLLRSQTETLLVTPKVKTKTYGERRFDKAASNLWNGLPTQLRNEKSLSSFKKHLKTFLFKLAYGD